MSDFNDRIIAEFRANEGRVGGPFAGSPMLLLHSTGAKSGEERVNPLATFPQDEGWVIVASAAGQPKNPGWYYNLLANPETTIEFGTETVPVRATVVEEGRDALWAHVIATNPGFQGYQDRAERTIPLVRLTPR